MKYEISQTFASQLRVMINTIVPCYVKEGKYHLNIAFGCTGGQHRSVTMANKMAEVLKKTAIESPLNTAIFDGIMNVTILRRCLFAPSCAWLGKTDSGGSKATSEYCG